MNFKRASGLLEKVTKKTFEKRGFSQFELLTQWGEIVGDRLAEIIRPLRLSFKGNGLGATLFIEVEGAFIPEVDLQKDIIIERVNRFYGYLAVSRIAIRKSSNFDYVNKIRSEKHDEKTAYSGTEKSLDKRSIDLKTLLDELEHIKHDQFRESLIEYCKLYLRNGKFS